MTLSALSATTQNTVTSATQEKAPNNVSNASYSTIASSLSAAAPYTDAEVKSFFANKPSEEQIATQAAAMGLNEGQILSAMKTAGYGGSDPAALKVGIDHFMSTHSDTYAWGANGSVVNTAKSTLAAATSITDWSKVTPSQLKAQSAAWAARGMTIGEQADRARASGVDGLVLSKFLAENRLSNKGDQYPNGLTGVIDKNGRNLSVAEVKAFFATNPSNQAMYDAWHGMGLNDNQMQHLMSIKNGTQYVPTMNTGQYDYAGNYTDPYFGSDAFTGYFTTDGTATGTRYGDSTTKLGAWSAPAGWGTAAGSAINTASTSGNTTVGTKVNTSA